MSENLFKDSNCPIQEVPAVDFDFITIDVCSPVPIPPPIFGCQTPTVPREPDTEVGLKCPTFKTTTDISVGYAGSGAEGCSIDPNPRCTIEFTKKDVDPCNYDIAVDISVPIPKPPCAPTITGGSVTVATGFADCGNDAAGDFFVTKNTTPGDCTTPDACEFVLDLNLYIPIPRPPCPDIDIVNFKVDYGYGDGACMQNTENKFSIVRRVTPGDCNTPDECTYDVDLEIAIPFPHPPCPEINVTNFQVNTGFNDAACTTGHENKFTITTKHVPGDGCNTPDICQFEVELELLIPIPRTPCPEINVKTFNLTTGYADRDCVADAPNRFEIATRHVPGSNCDDPGRCIFDIELELAVPIPPPRARTYTSINLQSRRVTRSKNA